MIKEGDYALFFDERGKKRLIKIRREGRFQSDLGYIEYKDVIGRYYGERFETSKNRFIWVLKPSLYDFIMKIKRRTQIVYPKDIGYIIVKLGVKHNSKILEIGTGSGALTTAFAWILSKEGLIDTFDKRCEFIELAKENVSKVNPEAKVNFYCIDALKADFKNEYYDIAFVDIDSPWNVVDRVYNALKPSGRVGFVLPTYNQVEKLLPYLDNKFIDLEGVEVFKRELQLKKGKIRPEFRMIGYTAILITGVKTII